MSAFDPARLVVFGISRSGPVSSTIICVCDRFPVGRWSRLDLPPLSGETSGAQSTTVNQAMSGRRGTGIAFSI